MIAVTTAWAVAAAAGAKALRFPGVSETLQDTFTQYFTRPDVADPWRRLVELNLNYWTRWVQEQARAPWLLLVLAAAVWALFGVTVCWRGWCAASRRRARRRWPPIPSPPRRSG